MADWLPGRNGIGKVMVELSSSAMHGWQEAERTRERRNQGEDDLPGHEPRDLPLPTRPCLHLQLQ